MIKGISVLWAFEDDIVSKTWSEWLSAHLSFSKPLHRYEGELDVSDSALLFSGVDRRSGEQVQFELPRHQISQLYLGFDETFRAIDTRGFGLSWKPLRIVFSQERLERKVYLIVNFGFGKIENDDFFEYLKSWLS